MKHFLEVLGLSKNFKQAEHEIRALDSISFCLERAESLAIVGPSGSGKTTLLSLLAGLEYPTDGKILLEGEELTALGEKELTRARAQNFGIVFQQFHLMPHLTALENVLLPLQIRGEARARARAMAALVSVGLGERSDHLPSQLSGGECQRVAIARAFVAEPKLLLADEPSGSLDQTTGARIIELLMSLAQDKGTTLILVTHDQLLAERCGRSLRIEGGKQA